jgi:hypothetical protein
MQYGANAIEDAAAAPTAHFGINHQFNSVSDG